MITWLFLLVSLAVVLEHVAHDRVLWIFLAAALAIIPSHIGVKG